MGLPRLLMPGATEDDAAGLAARLLTAIRATEWPQQQITVSIGVAEHKPEELNASALVAAADAALYAAKAAGRNCFVRRSETV